LRPFTCDTITVTAAKVPSAHQKHVAS
jgi:hypothetical protein